MQASNDNEKLVNLLESTLNPAMRKQAEDELGGVSQNIIKSNRSKSLGI